MNEGGEVFITLIFYNVKKSMKAAEMRMVYGMIIFLLSDVIEQ